MKELQSFVDNFGFGISVRDLAGKAYHYMRAQGHTTCIINDRYLEVDGVTYLFSKSRKAGGWIIKAI